MLKYDRLLVGYCQVDSADKTGISTLYEKIASIVTSLDHVGMPFNATWLAARDELLLLEDTHIDYGAFRDICNKHGLDQMDGNALISMLHTLGHIIYYDSDGLRDFIILKPDWLTKAIGYILEDKGTRNKNGILDHRRLSTIWQNYGDSTREVYPTSYFPYFLRLMEQYDVSVRLEGEDRSLISQMVAYERPIIEWTLDRTVSRSKLTLICMMEVAPPGLIAWTTVRHHRWSTNKHWRNGIFLRHEDGHEALIEFFSRTKKELAITVSGDYPPHFMSLLQDGLEQLVKERWSHLRYEFLVPCPTIENDEPCRGRFKLRTLHRLRAKSKSTHTCDECINDISISHLLEGYSTQTGTLNEQLEHMMTERHKEILMKFDAVDHANQKVQAQLAEMTRRVLKALLDTARRGPRLFTLSPSDPSSKLDPRNLLREELLLTLWCEHPGHEHALEGEKGRYIIIKQPQEWIARISPYMLLTIKILRILAPISSGILSLSDDALQKEYKIPVDVMTKLATAGSVVVPDIRNSTSHIDHLKYPISRAEGEGLRAFHNLLEQVGWSPGAGNLRRVTDKTSGDVLWVCADHYREYDPGLPILPAQMIL